MILVSVLETGLPGIAVPPGATITSRSAVRTRINFWRMVGLYTYLLREIEPMHLSVEGLRSWDWPYPVLQYLRGWPTPTGIIIDMALSLNLNIHPHYKYKHHCDWLSLVCLLSNLPLLTGAAMLCFISRRVSVAGKAGSRRRLSVAGFHGPAKPAFCRYRQGKLVK